MLDAGSVPDPIRWPWGRTREQFVGRRAPRFLEEPSASRSGASPPGSAGRPSRRIREAMGDAVVFLESRRRAITRGRCCATSRPAIAPAAPYRFFGATAESVRSRFRRRQDALRRRNWDLIEHARRAGRVTVRKHRGTRLEVDSIGQRRGPILTARPRTATPGSCRPPRSTPGAPTSTASSWPTGRSGPTSAGRSTRDWCANPVTLRIARGRITDVDSWHGSPGRVEEFLRCRTAMRSSRSGSAPTTASRASCRRTFFSTSVSRAFTSAWAAPTRTSRRRTSISTSSWAIAGSSWGAMSPSARPVRPSDDRGDSGLARLRRSGHAARRRVDEPPPGAGLGPADANSVAGGQQADGPVPMGLPPPVSAG